MSTVCPLLEVWTIPAARWIKPAKIRRKILDAGELSEGFNTGFVLRIQGIEYRKVTPELIDILEQIMVLQGIYSSIHKIPDL